MEIGALRPLQALAAAQLFKCRRLMVSLPRQYGGKTELGVRLTESLLRFPSTKSTLFLAKSHPSAKKMAREKFMRLFDKELFSVNTETIYLKKYPTSCGFIESVDKDPDRIRGGTYSFVHWAEVAFSKLEGQATIMDVFDRVINPTLRLRDAYAYLESTNNGKNGWYDLWNNASEFGFKTLKVSLSDMVYLGLVPAEEYETIKKTTQPDVFQQEYECEWVTFAGRTYPEFLGYHILPDMPPPEAWQTVAMGIDWGYTPSATCVLFAYVKDHCVYVFDEHYQTEELAIHTAQAIEGKVAQYGIRHYVCAADHEGDRNEELTRRGIKCFQAKKSDVLGNRIQIKEMFFADRLFIHPRCQNLIRDLQAAVWDGRKSDKGEIDYAQCTWGHFDAEAALRYLIREVSEIDEERPETNPLYKSDPNAAAEWQARRENKWEDR